MKAPPFPWMECPFLPPWGARNNNFAGRLGRAVLSWKLLLLDPLLLRRLLGLGPGEVLPLLGADLDPGPHALAAVDPPPPAGLGPRPGGEDARAPLAPPGEAPPVLRLLVLVDDQEVLLALVGADGLVGD